MNTLLVLVLAALLLSIPVWAVSARFRPRLASRSRVIMNWGFDGKPNSWASPRVALALTPALGSITQLLLAGGFAFFTPAEDRFLALPLMLFTAAVFTLIHAGHLHFAAKAGEP